MSLEYNISLDARRASLKKQIDLKGYVRIIEAHNGLSALIAQKAQVLQNGNTIEFDGFWESSFTDAASKGMPDAEIVGQDSRSHTIDEILNVTTKPLIVDGDTGGSPAQFEYFVKKLERLGVSAVIIEDKVFPKRCSLDTSAMQTLEDPNLFAQKIHRGNEVKFHDDFMIISRIESLITGTGLEDALKRTEIYIKAGVNGIMIHSKKDKPDDIFAFAAEYKKLCKRLKSRPLLVCVPTTFNLITDQELAEHGFNIIIHANHLLRAAHKAMKASAETILLNDRSFEAEPLCTSVSETFEVVGFERIKEKDQEYSKEQRLSVVIPAAGRDERFPNLPKALVKVGGKPILEHQLEIIHKVGLRKIALIRGYAGDQFDQTDISYYDNPDFDSKYSLHSLFCAQNSMENGFILLYSDVLFSEAIFRTLIASEGDIVLLVDNSYRYHRHEIDKRLDLVISRKKRSSYYRTLQPSTMTEVTRIGKKIDKNKADFEFFGIAYFSEKGAETIRKVYKDCLENAKGPFHEADSFDMASVTDLIQEAIDREFTVNALEVYKGWIDIHNPIDVEIAEKQILSNGKD